MSGLPKPRSITSRPSCLRFRLSWSTVAKTYGGSSSMRRNFILESIVGSAMAVESLRCRVCETEYPAVASGVCLRCFGPLEPVYDWDEVARAASREAIQAGPRSLWRYAAFLPTTPPAGATPAPVAARAAANGMRSVVLYPSTVEPEKLLATAVYGGEMFAVRGSYDDCSRLVIELAGELDWGFVNVNLRAYYAEGSKTLAFEIAEQLGWQLPDAVVAPIASGSLFTKVWQGLEQFRRVGLVSGTSPRLYGGQAQGCSPVASAFADERPVSPVRPATVAHSLAIGAPADGDLAVATANASGGAIYAVDEDAIGENMALLAALGGVFGETAAGVTVGALRAAADAGQLEADDRVVVLVTGTGLKTPQIVAVPERGEIEADADELLERLQVAA